MTACLMAGPSDLEAVRGKSSLDGIKMGCLMEIIWYLMEIVWRLNNLDFLLKLRFCRKWRILKRIKSSLNMISFLILIEKSRISGFIIKVQICLWNNLIHLFQLKFSHRLFHSLQLLQLELFHRLLNTFLNLQWLHFLNQMLSHQYHQLLVLNQYLPVNPRPPANPSAHHWLPHHKTPKPINNKTSHPSNKTNNPNPLTQLNPKIKKMISK